MLPLFESGIPLLRERLQRLPDADNITIAYPDEGAWKRFKYQFNDYPEVGAGASALVLPKFRFWRSALKKWYQFNGYPEMGGVASALPKSLGWMWTRAERKTTQQESRVGVTAV